MHIGFHGAAQTVTGSRHLLEINGRKILLDCGLYQGKRQDSYKYNQELGFDAGEVDAVILSHAHIDHSGNLPLLVKKGFTGPIYCTHATRDLCHSMLLDAGHIQERDVEFLNKKRAKKGESPVLPLYTQEDALKSLQYFESIAYGKQKKLFEGMQFTFWDAGHMLGSTFVVLDLEDRENGRDIRLVFSGDIGRKGLPIIRDPQTIDSADILIMESTYGDRLHEPINDTKDKLKNLILQIVKENGVLVVPSFAVGRAQQLVYELQKLHSAGEIPLIPIFVDSPLAIDATNAFRQHLDCYDQETLDYIAQYNDKDIFGFEKLQYTRRVEESMALNTLAPPFIVISASGMAESGRILHHLRNRIGNPANVVLFVGFQAENTLGRRLLDGVSPVRIFGEEHVVRAQVESMTGLSGHADSQELVNWVAAMKKKPRQTFLVHGELAAAQALAQKLSSDLGLERVTIPSLHQHVEIRSAR